MLKKMSIRMRLILGFMSVAFFMVLLVILTQVTTWQISSRLNYYVEVTIPNAEQIWQIKSSIETKESNLVMALVLQGQDKQQAEERLAMAVANEQDLQNAWQDFYQSTAANATELTQFYDQLNAIETVHKKVATLIRSSNAIEAYKVITGQYTPAKEAALNTLDSIIAGRDARVAEQAKSAKRTQRNVTLESYIILFASFICSALIAYCVIKSITLPLKEARDVALEMAKGNLSVNLLYESSDEIGTLTEALRSMIKSINTYIFDIDRAMELMADGNFVVRPSQPFLGDFANIERSITKFIVKMTHALSNLQESSAQVASGSELVSDGAQSLAQGSAEQSRSIEQLSEAVTEISSHVAQNAENSKKAKAMSDHATEGVTSSNENMELLVTAMDDINEKSEQIGKIIKAIEDIAFQTNILALNAAVEAARAGAAGKGFAVVADEVRNLATKSSNAAKDTAILIQSSIEAVRHGAKLVDQTASGLHGIVDSSRSAALLITEVMTATDEQASAIVQVSSGIAEITSVVMMNSETSEESATASNELSAQAALMMSIVSRFKIMKELLTENSGIVNIIVAEQHPARKQSAPRVINTNNSSNKY